MRSGRLTYRDGESPEDVEGDEALPLLLAGERLILPRRSPVVLDAGLQVVLVLDELVRPHLSSMDRGALETFRFLLAASSVCVGRRGLSSPPA